MAKGLSSLQKKILETMRYGGGWPKYRKIAWTVARGTRGGVKRGLKGKMIISPNFSVAFSRAVTRLEARGMMDRAFSPFYPERPVRILMLTGTGRAWLEGKVPAPLPWHGHR